MTIRASTGGEMLRLMPIMPRREVGSRARKTWGDLSQALYRTRVRAHEDWLSGKVDIDLVLRLETGFLAATGLARSLKADPVHLNAVLESSQLGVTTRSSRAALAQVAFSRATAGEAAAISTLFIFPSEA